MYIARPTRQMTNKQIYIACPAFQMANKQMYLTHPVQQMGNKQMYFACPEHRLANKQILLIAYLPCPKANAFRRYDEYFTILSRLLFVVKMVSPVS